jgi:fatty acid desaturase
MAFSTTIQQIEKPVSTTPSNELPDALLSMLILSVYGAQMSKKTLRKLKRKFFWTSLKLKAKSIFNPKPAVSDRTLIYILLGVALIALIVLAPIAALVLAVLALVLILAGVI